MASLPTSSGSKISLIVGIFLLTSSLAFAHGLATTKNELVGKYLVQLEYDTLGDVNAGDVNTFGFELIDPDTKISSDFDRVFIDIKKKDGPVVFLANLFPIDVSGIKTSRARLSIPTDGEYDFELQYFKGENKLIEHTFTLPVLPSYTSVDSSNTKGIYKYSWILTLILGIGLGMMFKPNRNKI